MLGSKRPTATSIISSAAFVWRVASVVGVDREFPGRRVAERRGLEQRERRGGAGRLNDVLSQHAAEVLIGRVVHAGGRDVGRRMAREQRDLVGGVLGGLRVLAVVQGHAADHDRGEAVQARLLHRLADPPGLRSVGPAREPARGVVDGDDPDGARGCLDVERERAPRLAGDRRLGLRDGEEVDAGGRLTRALRRGRSGEGRRERLRAAVRKVARTGQHIRRHAGALRELAVAARSAGVERLAAERGAPAADEQRRGAGAAGRHRPHAGDRGLEVRVGCVALSAGAAAAVQARRMAADGEAHRAGRRRRLGGLGRRAGRGREGTAFEPAHRSHAAEGRRVRTAPVEGRRRCVGHAAEQEPAAVSVDEDRARVGRHVRQVTASRPLEARAVQVDPAVGRLPQHHRVGR